MDLGPPHFMADLNELNAAGTTKIAGSDSVGNESNYAKVSSNQDLGTADIINSAGVSGNITVGTSATLAAVGGSNQANRKSLTVSNNGTATMYWGYSNTVTTANGTPVYKGQTLSWAVGPNVSVYLISSVAAQDTRVTEGA